MDLEDLSALLKLLNNKLLLATILESWKKDLSWIKEDLSLLLPKMKSLVFRKEIQETIKLSREWSMMTFTSTLATLSSG